MATSKLFPAVPHDLSSLVPAPEPGLRGNVMAGACLIVSPEQPFPSAAPLSA